VTLLEYRHIMGAADEGIRDARDADEHRRPAR
jgi:hypothetical protein